MVEQITVKFPNPATEAELIGAGRTPEEAKRIMNGRVFGVDFKVDENGNPIEQGIGSDANPLKSTHLKALEIVKEREKAAKPVDIEGIIKSITANTTGITPDVIAQAVAAGVQAGLAAAKEAEL